LSEKFSKEFSKAKKYAYRLISKRLYTEQEIAHKLKKKQFNPLVIKRILVELRDYSYINDLEFARLWIKTRMRLKPKGEALLRVELLKRGINKEVANQALAEVLKDYNQEKIVFNLVKQRISRLKLDFSLKSRSKIFSFLERRGFPSPLISRTVRQIFKDDYD
jgi:regulatory protein